MDQGCYTRLPWTPYRDPTDPKHIHLALPRERLVQHLDHTRGH